MVVILIQFFFFIFLFFTPARHFFARIEKKSFLNNLTKSLFFLKLKNSLPNILELSYTLYYIRFNHFYSNAQIRVEYFFFLVHEEDASSIPTSGTCFLLFFFVSPSHITPFLSPARPWLTRMTFKGSKSNQTMRLQSKTSISIFFFIMRP